MRRTSSAIVLLLVLASGLPACTGYSTWPPVPGEEERYAGKNQINWAPAPAVAGDAVSYVQLRFPPNVETPRGLAYTGPIAVNMPVGTDTDTYAQVAERVSRDGRVCMPASADNRELPTYHVTRVIVRNVTAEVDVVCPAPDYGVNMQGEPRYRGVTVYLNGGVGPWKVANIRSFPVGLFDVPERNEIEEAPAPPPPVLAP